MYIYIYIIIYIYIYIHTYNSMYICTKKSLNIPGNPLIYRGLG